MTESTQRTLPGQPDTSAAHANLRGVHPTLRYVGPDDELFLYDLFVTVRGPVLQHLAAELVQPLLRQQYFAQVVSHMARYPLADHHIVELGTSPIGQLRVERSSSALVLVDLSLLPRYQGRGIGTWLLDELIDESTYRHVPIEISIAEGHRARGWFERAGFRVRETDGVTDTLVRPLT